MRPATHQRLLVLLAPVAIVAIAIVVWMRWPDPRPLPEKEGAEPVTLPVIPLPSYSETRLLNTGSEAHFIGSAACAACHPANHKSYLLTPHSRALSDIDPAAEPPDGSFHHAASNRSYRVYRKDGQYRHEEVLKDEAGKEVARMDLPVRYLVGSGHFCRTYIVEVDGFLTESPVTWYTTKQKWDMSPGYDAPQHWGFERQVRVRCLICHAGRVEDAGTVHKLVLPEKAIGCENCHGPGSLHQDLHRSRKLAPDEEDLTIVHPGKLPRALQEAVCAGCHLGSPASVHLRGRQPTDVRPGRPLSDYRIDYRAKLPEEQMTVTGHVEQLRLSACYQKSEMTCLTCHDPHRREEPKDKVAFYRQKCLDCHASHPCKVAPAERIKKQPGDNCAACHMPRGDTDIPHLAFTHHRIGRHRPRPPAASAGAPELIPAVDDSRLSQPDRDRNLGMAYLEAVGKPPYDRYSEVYVERAREHLDAAYAGGLRDGETLASLAECYAGRDRLRAIGFARAALAAPDATPEVRARALAILADGEILGRHFDGAIGPLEEVTRLRRFGDDWRLLGWCYFQQGDAQKAIRTLEQALAIRPYRHTTHLALAEVYDRLGDTRRAAEHRATARWLFDHKQE